MPEPVSDATLRNQIKDEILRFFVPSPTGGSWRLNPFDAANAILPLLVERDRKVKEEAWAEGASARAAGESLGTPIGGIPNPYRIETKEEQK